MCPALAAPASSALPWNNAKQGAFVTALCADNRGRVWAATEDNGVACYNPITKQWTSFTNENTHGCLGDDDCYALACDRLGRIWAGTLNHGVSVYNGKTWQTYNRLTGPLGCHVIALATSPLNGDVWGATELGLFRYSLHANTWRYFTRADSLPSDQAGCLAFAKDGTLYIGTLCDGLAIATPKDDYDHWRHIPGPASPANQEQGTGLPSGLINALLVTRTGTVYCGTDAGLSWSDDKGATWRYRRGSDWLDKGAGAYNNGLSDDAKLSGLEVIPLHPRPGERSFAFSATTAGASGRFLPPRGFTGGGEWGGGDVVSTAGISYPAPQSVYQNERHGTFFWTGQRLVPNALYWVRLHEAEISLDAAGKRVFNVFANGQLALSHLDIFAAAGGKDKALVQELTVRADGQGSLRLAFQGSAADGALSPVDWSEDYITSLAEDGAGHLFVGHRQAGLEVFDEATAKSVTPAGSYSGYVNALLPTSHGHLLIGTYGDGLKAMDCASVPAMASNTVLSSAPAFPMPAPPPSAAELTALKLRVQSVNKPLPAPGAAYLGEDWQTQGDEIGRYGRQYAVLCAMNYVMTCNSRYDVQSVMGDHHDPGDGLRWYVTWMQTDNTRSLYAPAVGVRRQAEWDDHGEGYPLTHEGPDIWVHVHLGEGNLHRVSLYFMNKDGHSDNNRCRDYLVQIKPDLGSLAASDAAPPLAQARVRSFWGGVYESFLLRSPGDYYVKAAKNGSFNTILSGVFIDKVAGKATLEDGEALAYMNGVHYDPPPSGTLPTSARATAAASLWAALDTASGASGAMDMQNPYRLLAYRAMTASGGPATLLTAWRWSLRLWTAEDNEEFGAAMAHAQEAGVKLAQARTPAEVAAASE